MKVAIYCRVSTDDKEQDPERQIKPCSNYCELHNHTIVDIIKEHHTGDSDPFIRPLGSKLNNLKFGDGIVVYSMDRFTRQHPIKVIQMINNIKNKGLKLISITEPAFNMESEFSEILLYLISWFNNYFLTKLKRDVKSGLEKAKRDGKILGRPKVKINKFEIERLRNSGKSLREIAKETNLSLGTIQRCIKNLTTNN